MSKLDQPVVVAGASGIVGSHILRLLGQRGRKLRVLLRRSSSVAALSGLPVAIVYGDVLDPASPRAALAGFEEYLETKALAMRVAR